MKKRSILILLFTNMLFSQHHLKLAAIFSDNMVLQQESKVKIWGRDLAGTRIKITTSWNNRTYKTKVKSNGVWSLKVNTINAGGPYQLVVNGSSTKVLKNVLLGEVWLCSGQSNMQMPLSGFPKQPVEFGKEEIAATNTSPLIRHIEIPRRMLHTPQDTLGKIEKKNTWQMPNAASKKNFSAVAYFFAKKLQDSLQIPVGVINCSRGGTIIEAWFDKKTIQKFDFIKPADLTKIPRINTPSVAYNAMLKPIIGYGIRGVLWYQGEGNRGRGGEYEILLPALVKSWRKHWKNDFPFYYVQTTPFKLENAPFWESLRSAYFDMQASLGNIGMVSTLDLGDCDKIHPPKKKPIGDRLAFWALANTYGRNNIEFSGPISNKIRKEANALKISFEFVAEGLKFGPNGPEGFEIAGDDKVYYPAQVFINKDNSISVFNKKVRHPISVKYGSGQCPKPASLFNSVNLPASSFSMSIKK